LDDKEGTKLSGRLVHPESGFEDRFKVVSGSLHGVTRIFTRRPHVELLLAVRHDIGCKEVTGVAPLSSKKS
jgi:hypothetical protein